MGICEECLYFDVCNSWHKELEEEGLATGAFFQHKCKDFKSKADFVEVKHGRWEMRRVIIFDDELVGYRCSECNTTWDTDTSYCPYCGAKMKEGA